MSKQIIPIIMDNNFNKLCLLENYKSLIWTTRYYDHGDFEITLPFNELLVQACQCSYYVMRTDDDNVGIIEKVDARVTETNERYFVISGRFLTQILARRIIAVQTQVSGTVASCINQLITDAIISPTIPERRISNFILGDYSTRETMEAQYTGKNLFTVIHDICQQYGLGIKITLNSSNQFVFQIYQGTDRSFNQDVNPHVAFSENMDNLINAEFEVDFKNVVTAVLAAGEGEGTDRKTIWATSDKLSVLTATGLYRYEYYLDARNTSTDEGEISDADYYNQLSELAKEQFTTYETKTSGEVNFQFLEYGTDINIGDLVSIIDETVGLNTTVRIIEVIESIDASGMYQLIPTFGV